MKDRTKKTAQTAWWLFANLSGLAVLSLGCAWLVVSAFSSNGAVWTSSDLRVITSTIKVGGRIAYSVDMVAHESCPGEVVTTLVSLTNHGPPAIVTFRRPVTRVGETINDSTISLQLPESVFPARWRVVSAVDSRCPKRSQLDKTAEFEIEVTP